MERIVLVTGLVLVLGSLAGAQTFYQVDAGEETALVNTSTRLECEECPVSSWTVRLKIPNDARILNVTSQNGEVIRSRTSGDILKVETSTPAARSEKITAVYTTKAGRNRVKGGLYTRRLSLSGFPERTTSGIIRSENLLNARVGEGFRFSPGEDSVNFSGEGPTNVVIATGQGREKENFEFFGKPTERSSLAYRISAGTLSTSNRFERFPVAKLDTETYDRRLNNWSAGQYVNATIVMRSDLENEEAPILAHETVHGLNQQLLGAGSIDAWFDEGTARYVEYLTRKALSANNSDIRTRNVFGEDTSYTDYRNGRRYRYTLFSKGDRKDLWNYYSEDRNWMKNWSPERGRRDFGYAYSELIFRNHVSRNGSIRELYRELEMSNSSQSTWETLEGEVDLTPCKYSSRERFRSCLERVNSYDHPVYISEGRNLERNTLEVSSPVVDRPEGDVESGFRAAARDAIALFNSLLDRLLDIAGEKE
ncbi:MAG: hypothetical protein ABEJ03_04565 [Candidatus Nanohaloarchaea archaeon]